MTSEISLEADKEAVKKVIHDAIGWTLNKDKDLLFRAVAHDKDFFIYHPDGASSIRGFEKFRNHVENFFMKDAFRATSFDIRELRINLSRNGETAWYSARLDDFGEWQGRPTGWVNACWTGVLEKREGAWVIVQMHFSFASDEKKENGRGKFKKPAPY